MSHRTGDAYKSPKSARMRGFSFAVIAGLPLGEKGISPEAVAIKAEAVARPQRRKDNWAIQGFVKVRIARKTAGNALCQPFCSAVKVMASSVTSMVIFMPASSARSSV